jgi:hypothetical protein
MTKLLKQVFKTLSKLSDQEQDAVAAVVLDELEAENKWSAAFRASQDTLSALADEALAEFERGETTALSFPKGA